MRYLDEKRERIARGDKLALYKKLDEKCWALAALWRDPPRNIRPSDLEAWIEEAGLRSKILEYYEQL